MLLDDHPADSQDWTLARKSIFRHILTQSLYMTASLVVLGSIETIVIDGRSVAVGDRPQIEVDRVLHNQLLRNPFSIAPINGRWIIWPLLLITTAAL